MALLRNALLWCSTHPWPSQRLPRYRFVQRAVRQFMPGTTAEAALAEAEKLRQRNIQSLLTCLGENVHTLPEAEEVCNHYLGVIDKITERNLDAQISLKLTHLGLDLGFAGTLDRFVRIARRAKDHGNFVWIDMEASSYVDRTLDLFRKARQQYDNVGLCLQAYLYRTRADLESMRSLAPHIRLVKGAYNESPDVALPNKRDVDGELMKLAQQLLQDCAQNQALVAIASHDPAIVSRTKALVQELHTPRQAYEFEMLYGINRETQHLLAREGHPVRVLISYGEHWFPWYMRRLAERPANLLFALKHLFG